VRSGDQQGLAFLHVRPATSVDTQEQVPVRVLGQERSGRTECPAPRQGFEDLDLRTGSGRRRYGRSSVQYGPL